MNRNRVRTLLTTTLVIALIAAGCLADNKYVGSNADRTSLEKTSQAVRSAFARGDVATILAYHHPDVVKSLSYGNYLTGRDAVEADVTATLQRFNLEWKENHVRGMLIQGDTAVELTDFTIQGTPKDRSRPPFLFKGRAMIVYVRYKNSPTGWASIREIIQPAG
jgi:ketosteroid isomerase-like protein